MQGDIQPNLQFKPPQKLPSSIHLFYKLHFDNLLITNWAEIYEDIYWPQSHISRSLEDIFLLLLCYTKKIFD